MLKKIISYICLFVFCVCCNGKIKICSNIQKKLSLNKNYDINEIVAKCRDYEISDFQPNFIFARNNIYISKAIIEDLLPKISSQLGGNIPEEDFIYHWLDYTTALQIIENLCKIISFTNSNIPPFVLINYNLYVDDEQELFGIVTSEKLKYNKIIEYWIRQEKIQNGCHDIINLICEFKDYHYKLNSLLTKQEISSTYKILPNDFPIQARDTSNFKNMFGTPDIDVRTIIIQEIENIQFDILSKIEKPKDKKGKDKAIDVNINIHILREACNRYLSEFEPGRNFIPILKINQVTKSYYSEWAWIIQMHNAPSHLAIIFKNENDEYKAKKLVSYSTPICIYNKLIDITNFPLVPFFDTNLILKITKYSFL